MTEVEEEMIPPVIVKKLPYLGRRLNIIKQCLGVVEQATRICDIKSLLDGLSCVYGEVALIDEEARHAKERGEIADEEYYPSVDQMYRFINKINSDIGKKLSERCGCKWVPEEETETKT
ncbi:MAG: hypothetical protein DSO07_01090 [Thermoproteota archaeon]|uniref:Uncharacterized protein n=1 Tax=Candidatus Methanodesulfokora washburnensis TaxID=2478471 RepID=A0A429GGF0_9CREN|nr:hypothetical protein [Candidatus Methanodesulfokores washburnensis]RSN72972.1 hypothetical protein D6D85_11820 [Candidatus Methanodesulfokores washburnensis]TDA42110.1 MAG: hypothetical protein DSO07_01090 [Candidatus Korarchaeota archaeon]